MIRTGAEYRDSIRDSREIFINGERVNDVTTHPSFKPLVDIRANLYDMQHDPATREVMTVAGEDGEINVPPCGQLSLHGRVINVSADVTEDPRSGQSYYTARIEIDEESLEQIVDWKLVPGMPVEVFITTGERTALAYLAKPIMDQLERAFRDD